MKIFKIFTARKQSKFKKGRCTPTEKKSSYYFMPEIEKKNRKKKRSYIIVWGKSFVAKNIIALYYKIWFWIILFCAAIFLLFWPLLKIEHIYISGDNWLININKAYESLGYLRWENLLLAQSNDIIERLKNSQEPIKSIQIEADFPNSLYIEIGSHEIIFQTDTSFILRNGNIIEKKWIQSDVPEINISLIDTNNEYADNISQKDIQSIERLLNLLKKNISWFQISQIYYARNEHELLISLKNKNIFIFDLQNNIEAQVKQLSIYNKDTKNITSTLYTYIDVRVVGKLFLCWWNNENTCKKNLDTIYWAWVDRTLNLELSPLSQ